MKHKLDREICENLLKAVLIIFNSHMDKCDDLLWLYEASIAYLFKILGIILIEKNIAVPDRKLHRQIFLSKTENDFFTLDNLIKFQSKEYYLDNFFQKYSFNIKLRSEYFCEFIGILKKILVFDMLCPDFLGYLYEYFQQYKVVESNLSETKQLKLGFNNLELKYNLIFCEEARKKQGSFYTPPELVERLVKSGLKPILENTSSFKELLDIKIIDPACGGGNILIKVFDELCNKAFSEFNQSINPNDLKKLIFKNCILGVELNAFSCEVARFNLYINGAPVEYLENIYNGNFLTEDIFNDGYFTLVIGNPPYLNIESINVVERKLYQKSYKTAYRRFDISVLFIEKALEKSLSDNGVLSFLVSDKILNQNYALKLRELILNNYSLKEIISFKNANMFLNAFISPVTMTIQKNKNNNGYLRTIEISKNNEVENCIDQKVFSSLYSCSFKLGWNSCIQEIIERVQSKSVPLSEICYTSWGAQPGNAKKFIFSSPEMVDDIYKTHLKKMIRGGNIDRYSVSYSGDYLLYLTEGEHKLHRPAFKELFESEKLVIAEVTASKGIVSSLDDQGYYTNHSVINCMHKKNLLDADEALFPSRGIKLLEGFEPIKNYKWQENDIAYTRNCYVYKNSRFNNLDLRYVLAIINSSLINFYFKSYLSGDLNVFPELVRFLPIFDIKNIYPSKNSTINKYKNSINLMNFTEMTELLDASIKENDLWLVHELFKITVDKLIELKQKSNLSYFLTVSQILDNAVFSLYGLTQSHIELVCQ